MRSMCGYEKTRGHWYTNASITAHMLLNAAEGTNADRHSFSAHIKASSYGEYELETSDSLETSLKLSK